jgi:hypothetical protein
MDIIYDSPIGLEVSKYDYQEGYTISGNVNSEHTIKQFECAYDFESWVKKKGQFFAYAKTKRDAIAFVKRIEKLCEKVQEMFN